MLQKSLLQQLLTFRRAAEYTIGRQWKKAQNPNISHFS